MEQALPGPPKGTPSKGSKKGGTPKLYMTPQMQKRRDGLIPSLLNLGSNISRGAKRNPGGMNKPYRTNSQLLLQIRDADDGTSKYDREVPVLMESIRGAVESLVGPDKDIVSCEFNPKGCEFCLEFSPELNEADQNYRLEVILFANDVSGLTNYVVDTLLIPRQEGEPNPLAPPMKGYREAKGAFETLALKVRKSVVRYEFPDFPEGCKGRPFREVYQLNARLKSGSFATVCRGTHRATGRKVAIKCVLRKDLPPADDAAIYDEVAILSSLNHPHIVPLIDFFDEKDCYFIVMELMSGGDLFDRIGKKKSYSEADARDLVVKMLKAVAYCHARKIAHCDMKPKNLLLMSEENDSYIKLADFGFAARVHEPHSLTKQCGTPFFVSPEILMRKGYDQQSDMWSVGCIVYLLLSGNLPFMGRSQKELFRKIVAGKFEFDDQEWGHISEHAKDLVSRLLILDPTQRMTAAEAVRHEWLRASKDRLSKITLEATSQRLKTFNARMKLRSAMIAIDWVSSLRRMSSFSTRNLNKNNGATEAIPASSGHGGQRPTNNLLEAARRMKEADAEARQKQERSSSTKDEKRPSVSRQRSSSSATPEKGVRKSNSGDGKRMSGLSRKKSSSKESSKKSSKDQNVEI